MAGKIQALKNILVTAIRPRLIAFILLAELILNASLYFALKSGYGLLTATLFALIILGYFVLMLQK